MSEIDLSVERRLQEVEEFFAEENPTYKQSIRAFRKLFSAAERIRRRDPQFIKCNELAQQLIDQANNDSNIIGRALQVKLLLCPLYKPQESVSLFKKVKAIFPRLDSHSKEFLMQAFSKSIDGIALSSSRRSSQKLNDEEQDLVFDIYKQAVDQNNSFVSSKASLSLHRIVNLCPTKVPELLESFSLIAKSQTDQDLRLQEHIAKAMKALSDSVKAYISSTENVDQDELWNQYIDILEDLARSQYRPARELLAKRIHTIKDSVRQRPRVVIACDKVIDQLRYDPSPRVCASLHHGMRLMGVDQPRRFT